MTDNQLTEREMGIGSANLFIGFGVALLGAVLHLRYGDRTPLGRFRGSNTQKATVVGLLYLALGTLMAKDAVENKSKPAHRD